MKKKEIGKLLSERIKEGWKPYGGTSYGRYYNISDIDEIWSSDGLYFVSFVGEDYSGPVNLEHLLTKQAGLIQWLVDNDKIDTEKVIDTAKSSVIDTYYYEEGIDDIYIPLLMVLAIQDEPIEYLLSVIK